MALETWIDALAKVWEFTTPDGKTLRSFRLFEKAEFPESISEFPCAITYPSDVDCQYSAGGPAIDLWRGTTQFHLVPNMDKANIPYVVKFFALIRNAAAANLTLGGCANYFVLERPSSIQLRTLKYGSEDPHYGLLVNWTVKDNVTGSFTVAAGTP